MIRFDAIRARLRKAWLPMAVLDGSQDGPPRVEQPRAAEMAVESDGVEAASARLIAALEALEAALEGRQEQARSDEMLAAQVQALGADRARLAAELDAQTAYTRRLQATNREIARRLELAMQTIRSVLDAQPAANPLSEPSGKRRSPVAE